MNKFTTLVIISYIGALKVVYRKTVHCFVPSGAYFYSFYFLMCSNEYFDIKLIKMGTMVKSAILF